jgi:pectinesterase
MTRTLAFLGSASLLALAGCSDTTSLSPTPTRAAVDSTTTLRGTTVEVTTSASPADGRYTEAVFPEVDASTDITYATAPDLESGATIDLRLDVYTPAGDGLASRPVIVWVHGGGFKAGNKSATTQVAREWAQRGYVSVSIDYRIDRGSRCQETQDGRFTGDQLTAERSRCAAAILAAQHDTQAAVRWVRAQADRLGADPNRIAVGGFSAGAVTAVNVATRSDDPGDIGDDLDQPSAVSAALVASGCSFTPGAIDDSDAPLFLIASEHDQAVPYECTTATEDAARAAGITVEAVYFMGEGTHAKMLYEKYQDRIEPQWAAFLIEHLDLG